MEGNGMRLVPDAARFVCVMKLAFLHSQQRRRHILWMCYLGQLLGEKKASAAKVTIAPGSKGRQNPQCRSAWAGLQGPGLLKPVGYEMKMQGSITSAYMACFWGQVLSFWSFLRTARNMRGTWSLTWPPGCCCGIANNILCDMK